jgi:hypothetical protein
MKPRLPKVHYLKLHDGGPMGPRRRPYSRDKWKREMNREIVAAYNEFQFWQEPDQEEEQLV